MATIPGPVNGAKITVVPNGGDVYWTYAVDDHIDPAFNLRHTESATGQITTIAQGTKPGAIQIDFGVNGLTGDKLRWKILCLPLGTGRWPIYVQFFQGTQATEYLPISGVIEYTVDLSTAPSETVNDFIIFA